MLKLLLPIAYVLLLLGALIALSRIHKSVFYVGLVAIVTGYFVLLGDGHAWKNLDFILVGIAGVAAGFIPLAWFNRAARHVGLVTAAYVIYVAAEVYTRESGVMNVRGRGLALLWFYSMGLACGDRAWVPRQIILLGNYSLFAYIVQIGFLGVIRGPIRFLQLPDYGLTVGFVATLALTLLAVKAVEAFRARNKRFDTGYRAVFA